MDKSKSVLILGYYNRHNFGDDLFQYVFESILTNCNCHFYNFDDIKTINTSTTFDLVIIGGGDILNEMYFNTENLKFIQNLDCPVYCIGIGVSFPNTISLLDICDFFFMRNKTDYARIRDRYGIEYTDSIPDLGFFLGNPDYSKLSQDTHQLLTNTKVGVTKIGISLPYTWIANNPSYERIIDNIVHTITALAQTFEIVFIPFDTGHNPLNSDLLFINDLERRTTNIQHKITYIKETDISPQRMIEIYQMFDLLIGSRFHSIIMAILCEKPFVCLHSTTKLSLLQQDYESLQNLFIPIERDINLNPIKVNQNAVIFALQNVIFNYKNTVQAIRNIKQQEISKLTTFKTNILDNLISNLPIRTTPPSILNNDTLRNLLHKTITTSLERLHNHVKISDIDQILKGTPLGRLLPKSLYNDNTRKLITEEILWTITQDPYGPYYYGLFEKVFNFDFLAQVEWIIKDYYQNYKHSHISKDNQITIINKNFQQVHRSGWQMVVDDLLTKFKTNYKLNQPLIIDTYIDKTFHWNKSFYSFKRIIPYTQPWIGFIHHTFNDYINNFNCQELLQNQLFISSLHNCKCLIVMNRCLQKELDLALTKLGMNIRVESLNHPTDFNVIPFQWTKFLSNTQRKIVQVGNWLRNIYAIYRLDLPKDSLVTQKAILKNVNSDNYFVPNDFFYTFAQQFVENTTTSINTFDICKSTWNNHHLKGMYYNLLENYNSVLTIEHLPNHQYDLLLSENIIFLNLVDASAVNTIIECIVRNTPIIINRIDPVVEILGSDYPLYYDTFFQASLLLLNTNRILQAHSYLSTMDKTFLTIQKFTNDLSNILDSLN